jgi:hypothetical protein
MQLGCGLGFRLRLLDGERQVGLTADILWIHSVHGRRLEVFRSRVSGEAAQEGLMRGRHVLLGGHGALPEKELLHVAHDDFLVFAAGRV